MKKDRAYNARPVAACQSQAKKEGGIAPPRGRRSTLSDVSEDSGPLILSVDTATHGRSVALVRRGSLLAHVSGDALTRSSSEVLLEIDRALKGAAVKLRDVELLAVAAGPGSFTGLRAGLATVKAFAATLKRPAVAVQTLHAVAYAARPAENLIALIPAGRGEFFAQLLSVTPAGEVAELGRPAHVAPAALFGLASEIEGEVFWAGPGAHALAEQIREAAGHCGAAFQRAAAAGLPRPGRRAWTLAPDAGGLAPHVASLAAKEYFKGRTAAPDELRAVYVRASDAELKEQCQPQGSQAKENSGTRSGG